MQNLLKILAGGIIIEELVVPELITKIESELVFINLKEEDKKRVLDLLTVLKKDSLRHAEAVSRIIGEYDDI